PGASRSSRRLCPAKMRRLLVFRRQSSHRSTQALEATLPRRTQKSIPSRSTDLKTNVSAERTRPDRSAQGTCPEVRAQGRRPDLPAEGTTGNSDQAQYATTKQPTDVGRRSGSRSTATNRKTKTGNSTETINNQLWQFQQGSP